MSDRAIERVPAADHCVLRSTLEKWAATQPDKVFAKLSKTEAVTYAGMRDLAESTAAGLQALGVKQGDTVVVWLPNSLDCLRVWFGINWLGATYVPINTAYRGQLLQHVLHNAGAEVIIAHAELVGRLADVHIANLKTVVVVGCVTPELPRIAGREGFTLKVHGADALHGSRTDLAPLQQPIEPWDLQSIVYTSGTTGPSKGVMSSYAHLHAMSGAEGFYMLSADDRYLCNLPLFHVAGTIPVMGMLSRGGSIALVPSFSTETFWPSVVETESTVVLLLGVMATFIAKRAPSPDDRSHPLRKVIIVPLSEDGPTFSDRFGVEVYTLYNMTEISTPLVSELNPTKVGSCGQPRKGVEVRLVDANDCDVPPGTVGELLVRTDAPWAMNSGYFKNPEATASAWRNGWFHTGDGFWVDGEGTYFFSDRMKDSIRRRGENISSFEVEAEIALHPLVREVAVIPVPSALSEDDVLCVVAPVPGESIDPTELLEYLRPRMPHFMLPRYVRIVDELPKTATQKVLKHILRKDGVTTDTWDRDVAGVVVRREKF
ncbi:AMP-binding protein [Variovorax sp. dw_308]|uniref:AMP-binding protein n=1 Tax=Variovorax sp. dw_308 TaxID=2721546 RepID=UPI001C480C03|nr:AMP-binding protein [Variovorax sp. dw_308]